MKYLICVFIAVGIISCTVDYNPNANFLDTQNKLIVNSYLSPQHKIEISFYSTFSNNNISSYRAEKNINVLLKEDDTTIYNGICTDSILLLNYYPKAGYTYSITASVNGLDQVYAETRIPNPINCSVSYASKYGIINLRNFKLPTDNNSMWITANYLLGDTVSHVYYEYITNCLLVDNVNQSNDTYYRNEVLGSNYCDGFMRVKASNVQQLDSLLFSDMYHLLNKSAANYNGIRVNITTASSDYDQYNRTYYQQASTPPEDDINAMVYQPVHVYCNVKNGLGIFAGLNQSYYYIYK